MVEDRRADIKAHARSMRCPTWPVRLQALRPQQRARLRCRVGLVYQRGGVSIAPHAHHSHATSRTGRSAADTPDGVTLTQRRTPLVLCRCWPRRFAALIEHMHGASRHGVARFCRDKVSVACCVLRNHDPSLNYSRIRSSTHRKFSR